MASEEPTEADLDIEDAVLITGYSFLATTIVGVGADGSEAEMDGLIITIDGTHGINAEAVTHRYVMPMDAFDEFQNHGVKAILSYATDEEDTSDPG